MAGRSELIVVGNGMVGHRFVELLIAERRTTDFRVTVIGEESRPAYDRVGLSSYFAGKTADDLTLVEPGSYERAGIEVRRGDRVTAIDRASKTVALASGETLRYDHLILATGSYASRGSSQNTVTFHASQPPRACSASTSLWPTMPLPMTIRLLFVVIPPSRSVPVRCWW